MGIDKQPEISAQAEIPSFGFIVIPDGGESSTKFHILNSPNSGVIPLGTRIDQTGCLCAGAS